MLPVAARGLLFLSLAAPPLAAGELSRVFDPPRAPPDHRLQSAVTLDGYHPWQPITDLEAWKERRERVRRQILVAAGLWPMPPPADLRPTIHGRIERDAYTVEKVFFQSYPGFYVTGNLYRPRGGEGKRPAILCPHGHWSNGRFYERGEEEAKKQIEAGKEETLAGARYPLQARCAQLARLGCVVFHYDMAGYADSKQIPHAAGFGDVAAELRLQSAFGLQTYNTLRALDFLLSLEDVDPARVGVTGASGGGTQSFILCAIDDRPAAAFPAVMVSTAMQGGCVCENASHLRVGTGNIEFAAVAAPRPYGMTGANDWTREILTKGLPELKALWKAYGKEELVAAWCYPEFEHNYNQVSREHMYEWFNRHLALGFEPPVKEGSFEPIPPAQLAVFDEAHPLPADAADAERLREWLTRSSEEELERLVPQGSEDLEEYRRIVGGALEVLLHTGFPGPQGVEIQEHGRAEAGGRVLRKLTLSRRGSGESVPALLIQPQEWSGVAVVYVDGQGKRAGCFLTASFPPHERLQPQVERILEAGAAVLAPDVFLTGEFLGERLGTPEVGCRGAVGPDSDLLPKDKDRHGGFVGYTYGYNRTLLAQRVHDILTAIAGAGTLEGSKRVNLVGTGDAASWAILALALARDAVGRTAVAAPRLIDFSQVASPADPSFLPGALKYGGMPCFAGLGAPAPLRLFLEEDLPERTRAAYRAAGEPAALERLAPTAGPEAFEEWISR